MKRALVAVCALVPFGVLAVAAGCNDVLGFDERSFDPCVQYCDTMLTTCTQEHAQYQDEESCLATCALFEAGDPEKPTGNTIACRTAAVKRAQTSQAFSLECPAAGPGGFNGNSEQVCGDRCGTYCDLMSNICAGKSDVASLDLETCLTLCSGFADNPAYDPSVGEIKDHDNSVQCRLWHLSVASTLPDPHCAHADGSTKCDGVFSSTTAASTSTGM
jgi:hypothetical protein